MESGSEAQGESEFLFHPWSLVKSLGQVPNHLPIGLLTGKTGKTIVVTESEGCCQMDNRCIALNAVTRAPELFVGRHAEHIGGKTESDVEESETGKGVSRWKVPSTSPEQGNSSAST